VADAVVEVWHCDAAGLYSGFESASAAGGASSRTDEETYLRGAQVTDGDGTVQFVTAYPGWYPGRTVHVHAKVHLDNATALTTQLYFDDAVTDRVYEAEPYASEGGRDTRNEDDGTFAATNVLSLLRDDGDGWLGLLNVTLG
jgi:protocatechuate 3,4-dioxygenase beta subunit